VENWLRRDGFEKRRRKRKLLRFAPCKGCPFLLLNHFKSEEEEEEKVEKEELEEELRKKKKRN
jgi:hypothetical protein